MHGHGPHAPYHVQAEEPGHPGDRLLQQHQLLQQGHPIAAAGTGKARRRYDSCSDNTLFMPLLV